MSQDLKDKLIRLGSTNPELRGHLRPILAELDKSAGASEKDFLKTLKKIDRLLGKYSSLERAVKSFERHHGTYKGKPASAGKAMAAFAKVAKPLLGMLMGACLDLEELIDRGMLPPWADGYFGEFRTWKDFYYAVEGMEKGTSTVSQGKPWLGQNPKKIWIGMHPLKFSLEGYLSNVIRSTSHGGLAGHFEEIFAEEGGTRTSSRTAATSQEWEWGQETVYELGMDLLSALKGRSLNWDVDVDDLDRRGDDFQIDYTISVKMPLPDALAWLNENIEKRVLWFEDKGPITEAHLGKGWRVALRSSDDLDYTLRYRNGTLYFDNATKSFA